MIRSTPVRAALAAALALGLAGPAVAQSGPGTTGGTSQQAGPNGSSAGPIAPQLQAVQQSLLNAERQLSNPQAGGQPPNFDQTLRAVMAGQDTLTEMRTAQGGQETPAMRDAQRELQATRSLLETDRPELPRVLAQLRSAQNAVSSIGAGATGSITPSTPSEGGSGANRRQ